MRKDDAAQNLSVLCRMALNMLKRESTSQGAWPPNANAPDGTKTTYYWYWLSEMRLPCLSPRLAPGIISDIGTDACCI